MAEEVILKISADIDDVRKAQAEIQKGQNEIIASGEKTTAAIEGSTSATKKLAAGFNTVGLAIKSAGIGLILAVFIRLKEAFMQNQKVADFAATSFAFVSKVLSDVVNFVLDNALPAFEALQEAFSVEGLKKFGQAIIDNIIERFRSALDMFGYVGEAIMSLLKGDLSTAKEMAIKAGKELVDVSTGVNNTVDRAADAFNKASDKLKEYTKTTYDASKAQVELQKQAELAMIKNRGLIEQYDRAAEKQRQLRDDVSKPIPLRIEANEELGRILEEQEKLMIQNADIAVNAAASQLKMNNGNFEAQKAYMEALNERAAIEAQIEGLRSEQLVNYISLQKEAIEQEKSRADAEKAISDQILSDMDKIEQATLSAQDREWQAAYDHYQELILLAEKYGQDVSALRTAQAAATAEVDAKYAQQAADKVLAIEEAKQNAAYTLASTALGNVGLLVEQNAEASKGIAVAQTIWNTATGIMGALTSPGGWLVGLGAANWINAAAVAATGVTQLALIGRTTRQSSGGTPSTPSAGATSGANILNNQPAFQMRELFGQQNQVQRAYVVGNDITTQQQLDRRLRLSATFG